MRATCVRASAPINSFRELRSTVGCSPFLVDLAQRFPCAAGSRRGGFADGEDALSTEGGCSIETNILAAEVLKAIGRLHEAHRETVLLVYREGYSYVEAAIALEIPIGTIVSSTRRSAHGAGKTEIGAFDGR